MTRHLVVVDCETNGLNPDVHEAVEIAWWDLTTDERGCFVPKHDVSKVLAVAEVKALQINRYIDRIADTAHVDSTEQLRALHTALTGNTLGGSNPTFDAGMLRKFFAHGGRVGVLQPWHHRMWDLSAYAAGVLGLDELPGLARVCELLGIEPGDHTAEADVTATGLCFRALDALATKENR